jgi:hypothetical protein
MEKEIVGTLSLEEEISIFQNADQKEISGLIPGIHKQGLNIEQLKETLVIRAQEKIHVPGVDELDEDTINDLKAFFTELNTTDPVQNNENKVDDTNE